MKRTLLAFLGVFALSLGCSGSDENAVRTISTASAAEGATACTGKLGLPAAPLIPGAMGSLSTADVNGDGKMDLLGTSALVASVGVRLGLGGGEFAPEVDYPTTGTGSSSIVVADFNGDRKLDVATSNLNSKSASVLLNQGNGTFAAKVDYATGDMPEAVAVGDLNRDGKPDLVVANWGTTSGGGTISVLMNKGQGTFAPAVNYSVIYPQSIVVAELTGDGWPDIAFTSGNVYEHVDSTSVLVNKGFGKFDSGDYIYLASGEKDAGHVVAADLTGDGKIDLAVANYQSGSVSVFVNKGRKAFARGVPYPVERYVHDLAVADLTGDGKLDLVSTGPHVNVLANAGDGTFVPNVPYEMGADSRSIAAADWSGDGKTDLAVEDWAGQGINLMVNQGGGTFATPRSYPLGGSVSPLAVDLSGDGKPDLVALSSLYLRVSMNQGDGTFGPSSFLEVQPDPEAVVDADFTGDGKTDLAVMSYKTVRILRGEGNGAFTTYDNYTVKSARAIVAADLDGDGKIDLAVAQHPAALQGSVVTLINRGNGRFAPGIERSIAAREVNGFAAGDLNGDGTTDLVLAMANGAVDSVTVLLNDGAGNFGDAKQYALQRRAWKMVVTDLTGDAKPDIAVEDGSTVTVLANLGDGTFSTKADYPIEKSSWSSIAAVDLSGDGHPELVVAAHDSSTNYNVRVLFNDGHGTFAPAVHYYGGSSPESLVGADFTGDGRADLAVGNGGQMTILRNAGCLP